MGCLDATPQGCEPSFNRSTGQPACPALCGPDDAPLRTDLYGTAIPLYDSSARNCSGRACNADIVEQPFDPLSLNGKYAARATQIVAAHCGTCKAPPFFLYMAFAHTHTPLGYDAKFDNASARTFGQVFGNTLAEVDDAVGQVIGSLDEYGVAESTLVFLTADNGPANLGVVPCEDIGSPGPYIGAWQKTHGGGGGTSKGTTWEGGHRMVGIARWKNHISPGVSDALVSALDILPTIAALAGIALPTDRSFDGVDISDVLLHGGTTAHRTLFHPTKYDEVPAMRLGKYKARLSAMHSVARSHG